MMKRIPMKMVIIPCSGQISGFRQDRRIPLGLRMMDLRVVEAEDGKIKGV